MSNTFHIGVSKYLSSYSRNNKIAELLDRSNDTDQKLYDYITMYNISFLFKLVRNRGSNVPDPAWLPRELWVIIIPMIDANVDKLFHEYCYAWSEEKRQSHTRKSDIVFKTAGHIISKGYIYCTEQTCLDPIKDLVDSAEVHIKKDKLLQCIIL